MTRLNFRYITLLNVRIINFLIIELAPARSRTINVLVFFWLLGFGGLGPIIEGPIVGWIADAYGWAGPFYLMVGMSLLGSITMLKAYRMDQSIKQAQFMGTVTSQTA